MAQDSKPFVKIEFDVLLDSGAKKPATPATSLAMRDRSPHGSSGAKKEQVDMRVDLKSC